MLKDLFRADKSYWLLVMPIFHTLVPWLQFRVRALIPFFFCVLWLLPKLPRLLSRLQGRLGRAFSWAIFFFLLVELGLPFLFSIIGLQERPPYYLVATILSQIVFCVVAFYSIVFGKWRELRFLLIMMIAALSVAGVAALKGLTIEGMEGARNFVSLKESTVSLTNAEIETAKDIVGLGLGGYGFMYLCAWVAGVVLFAIGLIRQRKVKLLLCIPFVASVICIKGGGLGTPFAIVALEVVLFIFWKTLRSRAVVTVLAGGAIIIFFMMATVPQVFSFVAEPARAIAEQMQEGSYKDRLVSIADSASGDKGSYAYERAQLQLKSLDAFGRNFFMGVYGPGGSGRQIELGGHSYFFDLLGAYGLFGFIIWLFFMLSMTHFLKVAVHYCGTRRWLVLPSLYMGVFFFSSVANPVIFNGVIVLLIFCLVASECHGIGRASVPPFHGWGGPL